MEQHGSPQGADASVGGRQGEPGDRVRPRSDQPGECLGLWFEEQGSLRELKM